MYKELFENIHKRLEDELPPHLVYHSPRHTRIVIEQGKFLAEKEEVPQAEKALIEIACLFHDTGFLEQVQEHEEKSCELASRELPNYGYSENDIKKICGMIRATKVPQRPFNLNEKIVADADLFYLGTPKYGKFSQRLYEELQFLNPEINDRKWFEIQVNFLKAHHFHTNYGIQVLEPEKQKNLSNLIESNKEFL